MIVFDGLALLKVVPIQPRLRQFCLLSWGNVTSARAVRKFSGLQYESLEESYQKTTVDADSKNKDKHPLILSGYGPGVFKFAHISIKGSVAMADKAVLKWNVTDANEITAASFSMFYLMHPNIDIVVVGTGDQLVPINADVISEVARRGVKLEIQDTRHACGTYNLLKRDRPRDIGAALIPVTKITEGHQRNLKGTRLRLE